MKLNIIVSTLLITTGFMISGCGNDDSDSNDTATYDCTKSDTNFTRSMSASGKFVIDCSGEYIDLKLKDDINSITLDEYRTTEKGSGNGSDGAWTFVETFDLQTGVVHTEDVSVEYGTVICETTYDTSDFNRTFSKGNDIWDVLNVAYSDQLQKISSTCPAWMDEDDDANETGTDLFTVNIVDTDGETSKIILYDIY